METLNENKKITYSEYFANSSELHHAFFLQFATKATERYILSSLTVEQIKESLNNGDKHLNDLKIPFNHQSSNGGWWWDYAPINHSLLKELRGHNTRSTITCVAKALAKELAKKS